MSAMYPEYESLTARAAASVRADGGLVDPAKLRKVERLARPQDWRLAVLGHADRPSLIEMHLLLLADEAGVNPPLPADIIEQRAVIEARRRADNDAAATRRRTISAEWSALVKALPVPVGVAYNYSGPNHLENWTQGADHVILRADLTAGRLHRKAGQALCTTPSTDGHQLFDEPDEPDQRTPTCKACIRIACRVAGLTAPTMIQLGKR